MSWNGTITPMACMTGTTSNAAHIYSLHFCVLMG